MDRQRRRQVLDVLLEGLARLEYRGYDSAGMALVGPRRSDGSLWRARAANGTRSLDDLIKRADDGPDVRGSPASATPGGPPTAGPPRTNAHPHVDCSGRIALVHNGIIENHLELIDELVAGGARSSSRRPTPRSWPT